MISQTTAPTTAATQGADSYARLRPRDVAGLVDRAFRIYRGHFLTYLAISAIVYIPIQILIQAVTFFFVGNGSLLDSGFATTRDSELIAILLAAMASFLLTALRNSILAVSQAATNVAMLDDMDAAPVSASGAYRALAARVGPLIGVILVLFAVNAGVFLPGVTSSLGLFTGTDANTGVLVCCGFVVGIVVFIFAVRYIVLFQLAVPALITEGLDARPALRRSSALIKGSWWRTAGLILLIYAMDTVIAAGPAALIGSVVAIFLDFDITLYQVAINAVELVTGLFFLPVQMIVITLYYFDLRVRKEGFDIEAALDRAYPLTRQPEPVAYSPFVTTQPAPPVEAPRYTPSASAMYPPVLGGVAPPQDGQDASQPETEEPRSTPGEEGRA